MLENNLLYINCLMISTERFKRILLYIFVIDNVVVTLINFKKNNRLIMFMWL